MSRRRARRGPVRNRLEYVALRLAEAGLRCLPERTARRVGRALGWLAFPLLRRHRHVAIGNVATALGVPRAEAVRIARASFGHMGEMLAEVAWAPRWVRDPRATRRSVIPPGMLALRDHLARTGRGAIIATGHLGNWEHTSFALPPIGVPFDTVSRPADNPLIWALVQRRRTLVGQGLIDKHGASAGVARSVRAGRAVAIIFDQRAKQNSVVAPFFGRDALTTVAPAMLAIRNRCPIFFATTHRRPDGRHAFTMDPAWDPPRTGDLRADVAVATAELNRRLEARIRAHPEQYVWAHDRWRPARDGGDEPEAG